MDLTHQHERFREHSYPPDFEKNEKMRDFLETVLAEDEAEDEDKMKALEEFVEVRGVVSMGKRGREEGAGARVAGWKASTVM